MLAAGRAGSDSSTTSNLVGPDVAQTSDTIPIMSTRKSGMSSRAAQKIASSGGACVNHTVVQFAHARLPFGGVKLSGYGRELSIEGMHEFLNVRAVWIGDMPSVA